MRTEKDMSASQLTQESTLSSFDTQSRLYLDQAPNSNPSVIYVASGDHGEVIRFALDAERVTILTTLMS